MFVKMNLILVVLWMTISGTLSSSWSSSINSIFTTRSVKSSAEFEMNKDLMESLANGAQMALDSCQNKFKWDRWNCPEFAFSRRGRQPSTKETAYVLSITSAGVVHSITRNCSRGELQDCGCDAGLSARTETSVDGQWNWGGCSDYLDYGEHVAKNVLDALERGRDPQAVANLHNNAAGRMAIRSTMQKRCRCHGVSGSCAMQTCWMQMAPFHEVADVLRAKYENAQRIDLGPRFNTVGDLGVFKEVPEEDFVYLINSPDYCQTDFSNRWNGTKGRACSRNRGDTITPAERKSCKTLCRSCGHRVRRERRQLTQRCNCTFHWCCEVKCDTCTEQVDEFFCEY